MTNNLTKRITKISVLILSIFYISIGTTSSAYAQNVTVNDLIKQFNYTVSNKNEDLYGYDDPDEGDYEVIQNTQRTLNERTKLAAVNRLPNVPWQTALANIVKMLLNITGAITLVAFTVGGTMMVVSSGNTNMLEQGKKITMYSIAGLVIIAVSYALVIGVSELQIFTNTGGT